MPVRDLRAPVPLRRGACGTTPRARKAQERQRLGQSEQAREVLIGLLLPAAGPDEVEIGGERKQVSGGGGRKKVRYALDRVEGAVDRPGIAGGQAPSCGGAWRAKQRDDAIDVDHQQRAPKRL